MMELIVKSFSLCDIGGSDFLAFTHLKNRYGFADKVYMPEVDQNLVKTNLLNRTNQLNRPRGGISVMPNTFKLNIKLVKFLVTGHKRFENGHSLSSNAKHETYVMLFKDNTFYNGEDIIDIVQLSVNCLIDDFIFARSDYFDYERYYLADLSLINFGYLEFRSYLFSPTSEKEKRFVLLDRYVRSVHRRHLRYFWLQNQANNA